jgi:SAM-dependent methyltransferase
MATSAQTCLFPEELASYFSPIYGTTPQTKMHTIAFMAHRQTLIQNWEIPAGAKVFEIGPGQGDMTIPLADAVGPTGRVVGVGPAEDVYDTPWLADAHKHILVCPVGQQIEFVRAQAQECFQSFKEPAPFDYVVFSYCIPYFTGADNLPRMLELARKYTKAAKLLIADYTLSASVLAGVPHVLMSLTLCALEGFLGGTSLQNIHVLMSPAKILSIAKAAGWELHKEAMLSFDRVRLDRMMDLVNNFRGKLR